MECALLCSSCRWMEPLEGIRQAIAAGNYRYRRHARQRLSSREIDVDEVEQAIASGEVIEDYPDDKYRPSCLTLGRTAAGRALHVQCRYAEPDVIVVTQYEPDPAEWSPDLRVRRGPRP